LTHLLDALQSNEVIDDSGSMQFEENGERIDDLKLVLSRVSHAATMWDPDGISVRFMNSNLPGSLLDNVRGEQQIDQVSLLNISQLKGYAYDVLRSCARSNSQASHLWVVN